MMQLEKKLKEFGSVPVGHSTLLSILGDYRSPNDKIARMIGDGGGFVAAKYCELTE